MPRLGMQCLATAAGEKVQPPSPVRRGKRFNPLALSAKSMGLFFLNLTNYDAY